ncbi:Septum formation protein Maf [Fervidicola ferrireducens]|uniref:dTTP/UTP pyrophosphatase n=1 Tax=Fervidicola ferrireducens TaxID=520764 RepID=A0A140LA65_9FIRM|nr:Septum formation protein Maf [Fervidicola ferrireducens]
MASASPRRQKLLKQIGLDFEIIPSSIDETVPPGVAPDVAAVKLAENKAIDVARRLKDGIVIAADTVVALDDSILGKPKDEEEARKMLERLSGRWHRVFTGIAVIDSSSSKKVTDYEESRVKFKNLSSVEIENYIRTGEPMDKAGAYGIQGKGALLVEKIEGCYYNIVGLPLFRLSLVLSHFGVKIL